MFFTFSLHNISLWFPTSWSSAFIALRYCLSRWHDSNTSDYSIRFCYLQLYFPTLHSSQVNDVLRYYLLNYLLNLEGSRKLDPIETLNFEEGYHSSLYVQKRIKVAEATQCVGLFSSRVGNPFLCTQLHLSGLIMRVPPSKGGGIASVSIFGIRFMSPNGHCKMNASLFRRVGGVGVEDRGHLTLGLIGSKTPSLVFVSCPSH